MILPSQIGEIATAVCRRFEISVEEIRSPSHLRRHSLPRHVLCRLLWAGGLTLTAIAEWLYRDHSTVAHALKRIERERIADPELDSIVRELAQKAGLSDKIEIDLFRVKVKPATGVALADRIRDLSSHDAVLVTASNVIIDADGYVTAAPPVEQLTRLYDVDFKMMGTAFVPLKAKK